MRSLLTGRALAATCGAFAGLAAWLSLGTLASVGDHALPSWVGLLPPAWLLLLLAGSGALAGWTLNTQSPLLLMLPAPIVLAWCGVASPSVLIWAGPSAVLLWALLAVAGSSRWRLRQHPLEPDTMPWLTRGATTAALAGLGLLAWQVRPGHVSGDEPHYLLIAGSVLADGDLELTNDYDLERQRPYYGGSLEPRHTILTTAGEQYSFHGIGTGVLVAPGFALAGVTGARLTALLISLAGALVLWKVARESTGAAAPALVAVSAIVLSLPWLVQSSSLYPDGLAAAVTSVALWTMLRIERGQAPALPALIATGAALATLPWLHVRLSAIAAAFGLALVWLTVRRRLQLHQLVWTLAVPAVSAELWLASFYLAFHTWNPMAPFHQAAAGSLIAAPAGLLGLLVDHEYGLLVYAPAMAFAVPGILRGARLAPATVAAGAGAMLVTMVTAASYVWWGGTSGPARFLVPVLPVAALGVGLFWASASAISRAAVLAAIALGAGVSLLGLADGGAYAIGNPDARFTVWEWANANVDLAAALPSVFRAGTSASKELVVATVWCGSAAAIASVLWPAVRRWPSHLSPLTAWAVVLWISVSASFVWAWRGIDGLTGDRAQVAMLRAATCSWLQTAVVGLWPSSRADALAQLRVRHAPEGGAMLLHLTEVPAGRYEVLITGPPDESVEVAIAAGASGGVLWTWPATNGSTQPFSLSLPVRTLQVSLSREQRQAARPEFVASDLSAVASAKVEALGTGPEEIARRVPDRWSAALRPLEVVRGRALPEAQHVARVGDLLVYALDGLVEAEPGALWLWGGRRTSLVFSSIDGQATAVELRLEATDASVDLRLEMPGRNLEVSLAPGAPHDLSSDLDSSLRPWLVDASGPRLPRAVLITAGATAPAQ